MVDQGVEQGTEIKTIAVIGAGQMGSGIAHVAALAGYEVLLHDVNQAQIEKALATIAGNFARQERGDKITAGTSQAALARIKAAADFTACTAAGLVIESAVEDEAAKSALFSAMCPHLAPDTLVVTNTSSISVTRLASSCGSPERFMGMHFMNPVPVMELVELVRGIATSDTTYERVRQVALRMKKVPVLVEDFPGFIVNRVLMPMINEGIYTLHEGVGSIADIDAAMKLGAHHPMGPLELADFIGLDTCLAIMQVLHEGMADPKYRPCPLLVKYVDAGWLGRKSGRGFYDYSQTPPRPTR